jgi:hypothetical protein
MENLQKDFLPYELSLKMKQLGFDEPCLMYWNDFGKTSINRFQLHNKIDEWCQNYIEAPLYQQAFRWFREKYDWQHSIEPTADQHRFEVGYNYWVWNSKTGEEYHTMPKNRPTGDWEYETYEEAELACLEKLIQIVKNK